MKSDILELPEAIDAARQTSNESGINDGLNYIDGDILNIELRNNYDLVFLGNIIHHFSEKENAFILKKLSNKINPGGTIAIWDIFDTGLPEDITGAGFSLLFHITSKAECYSSGKIKELLGTAGYSDIIIGKPSENATHTLVTARKDE